MGAGKEATDETRTGRTDDAGGGQVMPGWPRCAWVRVGVPAWCAEGRSHKINYQRALRRFRPFVSGNRGVRIWGASREGKEPRRPPNDASMLGLKIQADQGMEEAPLKSSWRRPVAVRKSGANSVAGREGDCRIGSRRKGRERDRQASDRERADCEIPKSLIENDLRIENPIGTRVASGAGRRLGPAASRGGRVGRRLHRVNDSDSEIVRGSGASPSEESRSR